MATAAPIDGYGGSYWTSTVDCNVPPYIPIEYDRLHVCSHGTQVFRKYLPALKGSAMGVKLDQLHGVYNPLGFRKLNDESAQIREYGYIPGLSFVAAYHEIKAAIGMIYHNVIRNQNFFFSRTEDRVHTDGKTKLQTIQKIEIELGIWQRLAVLLKALGILLRGILNAAQVGFLFYPLDKMC